MKKIVRIFFIIALITGNFNSIIFAQTESDKINTLLTDLSGSMYANKKNNEKFEQSVLNLCNQDSKFNTYELETLNNFEYVGNKVRLEVILTDEEQLNSLTQFSNDIIVENHFHSLGQILIPISQIQELSTKEYIRYIRSPAKAIPDVISEGVSVIGANLVQNIGFYGAGVKIAIIDLGFLGYSTNPDLPSSRIKEVISFRADQDIACGEVHGTACAEIVLDVAPQADIYLYNFGTVSELNDAVSHAISIGINIISFSVGFVGINDFNGIGYNDYGNVCSIVNNARSHGILFIVSSGNQAERHYEGTFTDGDSDNWHNFEPGSEGLPLGYLSGGSYVHLVLSWNDWPYADQDYDLYLINDEGNIVGYSLEVQSGTQPPVEGIVGYTSYSDYYYVAIKKYQATSNVHFELYSFNNYFYTYNHPESSLMCPADASGAMTVGATYWQNNNIESFSSQGPTNDGRIKPDITAPDGVSTYAYGTGNFYGTSASSPHTAGAAALLKSVNSSLTANQIQTILESTSVPLGASGKDNLYGSGRINVWNAFNSAMVNIRPIAYPDYYTTNEDMSLILSSPGVLTNDIDGDHDSLTAIKVTNTSHGTLTKFYNNGSFSYIPASNYIGADSFTYKVYDGTVYSTVIAVHINVTSVNDPPIVDNIPNQTIAEGSIFTSTNLDNYVNDADNTDAQMTWTYSGNSQLIVSIINRVATISIPNINWYGAETITFNTTDPLGLWDTDTAVFTVTSVNDPPIANDDTVIVMEDSISNQINVRANDTDIEGDILTIISVTQSSHGFSSSNGNYVYYTPTTNYSGLDSFTYTINDGHGGNDTAIGSIIVTEVNDPPIASFSFEPINPETQEIVFFNSTSYDSDGVISNYTWDFGDGNKSYQQKTTHRYSDNGTYLITLKIMDNQGLNKTIQKTIRVSPNSAPNTPSNPSPTSGSNNIQLSANLSWNGGDPNYDTVVYDVYFGMTNPPEKIKNRQSEVTYNPGTLNFTTTYYWKIIAWDSHGENATSPIWDFTTRTNHPPDTTPDSYTTNEDITLSVTAPGVLANDIDSDGDVMTVVKISGTNYGSLTLNSNGSFIYIPLANYYGSDTFTYKVYDRFVYSTEENVTISIVSVNDPPVLGTPSPGNGTTTNKVSFTWNIPITDIEGDSISWTIQCNNGQTNTSTGTNNGTKALTLSGLAYSSVYKIWVNATDPIGSGQYTRKWYTITPKKAAGGGGGGGGGGGATVPQNKKPIADASAGEPYRGYINSAITFDGSKSYDPNGTIIKWLWVFGDNTNDTGKIVSHIYTKAGTYSVTLTVTDNEGATNIDTTTCVITQPNRPPTIPTIIGPTNGTKNIVYTYTALSTDADNDTIKYTFDFSESTSFSSDFLPNGTSYMMNHSWTSPGIYTITVTVTDNLTASSSQILVSIDALQISGVGNLIDYNGDGLYDAFYSDETKQTISIQKKDDNYLIDKNGDGNWEYMYNATHGLTAYQEQQKTPGFEMVFVLCTIGVVIFLWKKKRR